MDNCFFTKTRESYAAMRQCVRSTYCRLRYLHTQFLLKETYIFAPLVSTFKQYARTGLSGCLTLYTRTVTPTFRRTMMALFRPLLLLYHSYLLTYSLALRPSENFGLNYGRPFYPIDCLLLPPLNLYLP